jgi:hypothetical protein
MIRKLKLTALALYPKAFRARYGSEMTALIEESPARVRDLANLLAGAIAQHVRPEATLRATLPRDEQARLSMRGIIVCWGLFSVAGLGFYKTTENDAAHAVVQNSSVLPPAHLIVQVLAVLAAAASIAMGTAVVRRNAGEHSRLNALLAQVLAGSMLIMAIATAIYSVALSIQAPVLADALDGPLQANSASVSIDLQFGFMIACAAPALVAATRARRALS